MNAIISRLDMSRHKSYLLRILFDFSKDPVLWRNLVFKWGTALLLFYGLDRFSTDLDFDLSKNDVDEDDILKRVWKILKKHWDVKSLIIKRYTIFWLLLYSKIDYNIKVEINRRWVTWEAEAKTLMWIDFNVMKIEDMCANKFLALLWRNKTANRDIYDIHFIVSKNMLINKGRIESITWKSFTVYIQEVIEFINGLWPNYNILDWLGIVVEDKKKKWIKENLVKETIFLLGTYL